MNEFTKQWITSTLSPESIINIKSVNNTYLDVIRNESNTIHVHILSTDKHIQAIGLDYQSLLDSPKYSFREGLNKVAQLLNITSIN